MFQRKVKVISNERLVEDCYKLTLEPVSFLLDAQPGQFVHIRVGNSISPLLRRPFSLSKVTEEGVQIIYKVVGKGTMLLSRTGEGEFLDIVGLLGRGFTIDKDRENHLLIGGGMGIAPLVLLCQRIIQQEENVSIQAFLGFETSCRTICEEEFKEGNVQLHIATEDGSKGYKGLVSDLLQNYVCSLSSRKDISLYACGPIPMLKAIGKLALSLELPCQVLLEEMIGCGIGACRGCAVRGKKGYLLVCKQGPAFDIKEILWDNI